VDDSDRKDAERIRALIVNAQLPPDAFRAALMSIRPSERDAWLDVVLGLEDFIAEDGPALPRGGVPYLPCSVDVLLRMIGHAEVQAGDVFVDVGSGAGRAVALVHLLTGASTIGLEIQPDLVLASRALATRVNIPRVSSIEGDAALLAGRIQSGTIFFLYCPFSGDRLEQVIDGVEVIARTRPIRVCSVDLPLPRRPWLELVSPPEGDLAVYRSTRRGQDGREMAEPT
jgi:hypothetical protein